MHSEKQGTLEDVSLMPITQLRYLLERQKNILANKNLIRSLPDKGAKVAAFADSLKTQIKLKEDLPDLTDAFQRKVNIFPRDSRREEEQEKLFRGKSIDVTEPDKLDRQLRDELRGVRDDVVGENSSTIEEKRTGQNGASREEAAPSTRSTSLPPASTNDSAVEKKISKFKQSRQIAKGNDENEEEDGTSSSEIRRALREEAALKRNVLLDIFGETRATHLRNDSSSESRRPRFKENVPLNASNVKEIPKPDSIQRLVDGRKKIAAAVSPTPSLLLQDAVHPPPSQFEETKVIPLAESLRLQKKLESLSQSRIVDDAAARLVERLRGQALPPKDGTTTSAEAMAQLLRPKVEEMASRDSEKMNLVEGNFVDYREARDVDDIDDALYEDHRGASLNDDDDEAECF